jgi:hypothetical protein
MKYVVRRTTTINRHCPSETSTTTFPQTNPLPRLNQASRTPQTLQNPRRASTPQGNLRVERLGFGTRRSLFSSAQAGTQ